MHTQELYRKGLHALVAVTFALLAVHLEKQIILALASGLLLLFTFLRFAGIETKVHQVGRVSYGELFFALGVLVSAYSTLPNNLLLFQLAMVILAFADSIASLVGMRYGTHLYYIYDEKRSFEGSFACFVVSLSTLLLFGTPFIMALYVALALTSIEAIALRGSDNLFIPLITVLIFQYFV